jgi:hypothetical protein
LSLGNKPPRHPPSLKLWRINSEHQDRKKRDGRLRFSAGK